MNSIEIIPAIVPKEIEKTKQTFTLARSFADIIQIDIGDGLFTAHKTLSEKDLSAKDFPGNAIEVHLMVKDVEEEARLWIPRQPKRIILHAESHPRAQLIQDMKQAGIEAVIGCNAESDIRILEPYMHLVTSVLFLCITPPGEQGRPFIPEVLHKITAFRKKFPATVIEVDGGINETNMTQVVNAGATRLVMGSAIFHSTHHPSERYTRLRHMFL